MGQLRVDILQSQRLSPVLIFERDGVQKRIIIIGGPNGSGKTSFAKAFLPREAACPHFINADLIAAELSPSNPEAAALQAGRRMLSEISTCVSEGRSFSFETTLSGQVYLRHLRAWRQQGYVIELYFLALPSPEFASLRVAERVRQGGHNIAEHVIKRRFYSGFRNFVEHYSRYVDLWVLYDNSGDHPVVIEWGENF